MKMRFTKLLIRQSQSRHTSDAGCSQLVVTNSIVEKEWRGVVPRLCGRVRHLTAEYHESCLKFG